jgi:hypothetical protein
MLLSAFVLRSFASMIALAEPLRVQGAMMLLWPVYRPLRYQGCRCVLAPSVPVWLHAMLLKPETQGRRLETRQTVCLEGM